MSFHQQETMWVFALTVSLLCLTSEADVSCKNYNDVQVDWFIIYKTPTTRSEGQQLTGKEYIYMDSAGVTVTTPNNKLIDNPTGILANTLRPLFDHLSQNLSTFGYISYSDQPPGCNADKKFGHSKGVVLVDSLGSGVWLMHSTPQFPYRKKANKFWPPSGNAFSQTFICVTLDYSQFAAVGRHLQYIGAFPFDYYLPDDFHRELTQAADWEQLQPTKSYQQFTVNTHQFRAIAKSQSEQPMDGDLYVTIGELIESDVDAQTWGGQPNRSGSYCVQGKPNVYNVKTIHVEGLGTWEPSCDHSKWCVARDQNKNWVCIADVNRARTQYSRRGGALCLNNRNIQNKFQSFTRGKEDCNAPVNKKPCLGSSPIG